MRIGPLELRRTARAADTPPERQRAPRELGATGTVNLSGFLEPEEYLPELRFPASVKAYERMRRSHGSVNEALGHIKEPIVNATWDVEAASDDPTDLEVAAAVRAAYFDWQLDPWQQHVRQALTMLDFGFSLFEPTWHVVTDTISYTDPGSGDQVEVPARQFLTWKRFAHRLPRTVHRWNVSDGDLRSVTQLTWKGRGDGNGDFQEITIPADRLLLFVRQKEGDDFTGISLLRTAYRHWYMLDLIEKIEVIGLERFGNGIPIAYPSTAQASDSQQMAKFEEILRNLRSGDQTWVLSPGPKAQSSAAAQDGCLFEILAPPGPPPDFEKAKTYHRGAIMGNVLARFAELGHGSVGARATGDTQSQVWYSALHTVASLLCEIHNQDVIPRWVRANYASATRFPRLVVQDIEARNLQEFADAHSKLVAAGSVLPDRTYRGAVRRAIDMPDEDEDAEEQTAPALPEPGPLDRPDREPGDDPDPGALEEDTV